MTPTSAVCDSTSYPFSSRIEIHRLETAMPSSQPEGMPIEISFSSPPSPFVASGSSELQAARETARASVPPMAANRRVLRPKVMMSFLVVPRAGPAGRAEVNGLSAWP